MTFFSSSTIVDISSTKYLPRTLLEARDASLIARNSVSSLIDKAAVEIAGAISTVLTSFSNGVQISFHSSAKAPVCGSFAIVPTLFLIC